MGNIVLRKNRVTANTLIGKVGELTINTTDKTLYIHDGSTTGGFCLFRYNTSSAITSGEVPFSNGTQGVLQTSSNLKWTSPNLLINTYKAFHSGNLVAGTAISITESPTNTFTVANTGVTSITAGTGISITGSTGSITISATGGGATGISGVTSLEGLTGALTFVDGNITFGTSGSTQITATISSTPASTLTGTIPSGVLGNSTVNIGSTAVALNRASANLALTGISSVQFPGSTSGTITLQATAIAGTTTITLPATSGTLVLSGSIVNADIATGAAIAYSKLSLSGTIVNNDIATGAAIAYSKLSLSNSIVNNDIATGAAIAYSKLSLSNSIVNADIATTAAIAYSKLSLSNSIVNADISTTAAIAITKLAASTISGVSLGNNLNTLTFGSYLTGTSYNGSAARTIAVDATTAATASKVVARDASGTVFATTFSGSGASLTNIPNGALTNSSITVNGTVISLGGSGTVTANTTNSITFDNLGTGAVSGSTFNGSAAQTISYNTIGAPSTTGTNASGSWGISVTGSSASCTGNAATATVLQTSRTFSLTGDVTASAVSFNGSGDVQLSTTIGNGTVTSAKLASSLSLTTPTLSSPTISGVISSGPQGNKTIIVDYVPTSVSASVSVGYGYTVNANSITLTLPNTSLSDGDRISFIPGSNLINSYTISGNGNAIMNTDTSLTIDLAVPFDLIWNGTNTRWVLG